MRKAKVVIVFVLALTLLSAVTASAGPVIDRILKKGVLAVGTSGQQPPLTVKNKAGKIIGLDADLSLLMARSMGVDLKLVEMPFSELLPALMAGKVDMVVSGMTITPQRNLKVAFVGPYYISGKGILAKKEKASSFGDENRMNNPEFKLAALKGSTSQMFVQQRIPKAKLITPGTLDEALKLLFEDRVDAVVADVPYCVVTAFRYQDKGLAAGASPFTFEPLGVALPENDPLLANWVANILGALQASGDLKRLAESWFKDSSWLRQLP